MDADQNVTVAADLKVTGNDIQNSEGEATITMDADQNVTVVAGQLLFPDGTTLNPSIKAAGASTNAETVGFRFHSTTTGSLVVVANNEDQFIFSDGFLKPASNAAGINLGGNFKKFEEVIENVIIS